MIDEFSAGAVEGLLDGEHRRDRRRRRGSAPRPNRRTSRTAGAPAGRRVGGRRTDRPARRRWRAAAAACAESTAEIADRGDGRDRADPPARPGRAAPASRSPRRDRRRARWRGAAAGAPASPARPPATPPSGTAAGAARPRAPPPDLRHRPPRARGRRRECTRKAWRPTISMPGKSMSRCAATSSSSGSSSPAPGSATKRESSCVGTLTRAKRSSPLLGVAQLDGEVEAQVGEKGKRVRRDRRRAASAPGRCFARNSADSLPARRRVELAPGRDAHALIAQEREQQLLARSARARRACGGSAPRWPPAARARSSRPACAWRRRCAASCSRPETRIMKNSSRLLAAMARKRTRSSSGVRSSKRLGEHPVVEVEPGELAVGVEASVGEIPGDGAPTAPGGAARWIRWKAAVPRGLRR